MYLLSINKFKFNRASTWYFLPLLAVIGIENIIMGVSVSNVAELAANLTSFLAAFNQLVIGLVAINPSLSNCLEYVVPLM